MCYKYKNPHGQVFIWCEIANGKEHVSSYLRCFADMFEDYYDHYNYCPYCGKKLEIKSNELKLYQKVNYGTNIVKSGYP